jgi:hypothetical protein
VKIQAGGVYRLRDSVIRLPDGDKNSNRTNTSTALLATEWQEVMAQIVYCFDR